MNDPGRSAQITRLGGQSAFFLLGSIFTLVVGWPLQIYVARYLGAFGLGVFSLLEAATATVAGLLGLGLAPTLVRFIPVFLAHEQYRSIRRLIWAVTALLLFLGLLGATVFWLAEDVIVWMWPDLAGHPQAMALMALIIPLSMMSFTFQQGLRGFQEIRYMVLGSSVLQLTVKAILTVVLLAWGFQLMGYIWAVLVSVAFGLAWMAVGLWRRVATLPQQNDTVSTAEAMRTVLQYAGVMFTNSLLGLAAGRLDVYLLAVFIGPTAVGVLAVLRMLQNLPVVFLQMLTAVVAPMFVSAKARDACAELNFLYHLSTDWVFRLSAPLIIFLLVFANPLLRLYGQEFATQGMVPLLLLAIAQSVNLVVGPIGNLLNMTGLELTMLRLTIAQMALITVGMLLFVPAFGLMGAAFVLASGNVFINVAALRAASKQFGLKWRDPRFKRWIIPTVLTVAMALAARLWLPVDQLAVLTGVLLLLYGVFHGTSIALGLHPDDVVLLRHIHSKLAGISVPKLSGPDERM